MAAAKNITAQFCDAPVRDRSGALATCVTAVVIITGIFVLGRMLFKAYGTDGGLWWDDWTILATHTCGIGLSVIGIYGLAGHGLGKDIWTLPFDDITILLQFFYFSEVFYLLNITLLKMSILFFYMRLFTTPGTKKVLWVSQIFNGLFGLACVLVAIFQCRPIDYFWSRWDGEHQGTCLNFNAIGWTNAIVGITLDLWMLAIPLNKLRGLSLSWKKKAGVTLMLCAGTL